jgi:UPF0716 protein FxsA
LSFVGRFFLLVLVLGFVELYLLIKVAGAIGFLGTLGLCILTGMVGGSLVRSQGSGTLRRIQTEMAEGRMPAVEIVSGLGLMMVGVLLITPGFVTDVFGFLMLIPPLRLLVAGKLLKAFEGRIQVMPPMGGFPPGFGGFDADGAPRARADIIDIDPDAASTNDSKTNDSTGSNDGKTRRISGRNV